VGLFDFIQRWRSARDVTADNAPLVDAYSQLVHREMMVGRLADEAFGIQRRPIHVATRWQPYHRDDIREECEQGQFLRLGYFLDAMRADGTISGLAGIRTSGMIRRPKVYRGDPYLVDLLRGREPVTDETTGELLDPGRPGLFTKLAPTSELAAVFWDGILGGVGIGERVKGPDAIPALRHLDLHWLRYQYAEDRFIYQAPGATYEVRPGDGRWCIFMPKATRRPWMHGAWYPLALPFISKAGTALDRLRWQGQLADPLKAIESTATTTERQRSGLLKFILQKWHRSPGFVGRPGEKAYLVESNGRGYEVYNDSDDRADRAIQFTLSGQIVTGDGNKGFSSGDIFEAIQDSLIAETAEAAAEFIHRDILVPWAEEFWGTKDAPTVRWDVRSPAARKAEAEAMNAALDVAAKADPLLRERGREVDLDALLELQGQQLPSRELPKPKAAPALTSGGPQLRLLPSKAAP
jgi:hypothetical protein